MKPNQPLNQNTSFQLKSLPPILSMAQLLQVYPVSRSCVYNQMHQGLFVQSIQLSQKRRAWLTEEVLSILNAKVAGATDEQIRALVIQLRQNRTSTFRAV